MFSDVPPALRPHERGLRAVDIQHMEEQGGHEALRQRSVSALCSATHSPTAQGAQSQRGLDLPLSFPGAHTPKAGGPFHPVPPL